MTNTVMLEAVFSVQREVLSDRIKRSRRAKWLYNRMESVRQDKGTKVIGDRAEIAELVHIIEVNLDESWLVSVQPHSS